MPDSHLTQIYVAQNYSYANQNAVELCCPKFSQAKKHFYIPLHLCNACSVLLWLAERDTVLNIFLVLVLSYQGYKKQKILQTYHTCFILIRDLPVHNNP